MIGTITEKVAEEVKSRGQRSFLLQGEGADGGGENWGADGSREESCMVIDQGVNEKAKEVFDDVR